MTRKFEIFTVKINDVDIEFKIYEPTMTEYKEAAKAKNEVFVDALNAKAPLRAQINTLLRARGEWDDARETQFNNITKSILENERKLKMGGMKVSQGKQLALEMKKLRLELKTLLTDRSTLDSMTAEGQADNAHFNALVAACLVYNNTGERYFKSYEEYVLSTDVTIANTASQKLAELMYTIGSNAEKALPENQFLLKYKFMDENLHLINKDGKLVDEDGRLVDKKGRYIDKDGKYVDKYGNFVDNVGEYIVDEKPFLDEDGNEIVS